MSFLDCIQGHIDSERISKQKGRELQKKFDALTKQYIESGQEAGAAFKAAEDIINLEAEKTMARKRNKIQAALKTQDLNELLNATEGTIEKKVSDLYQRAFHRGESVRAGAYKFLNDVSRKFAPGFFQGKRDYNAVKGGIRAMIDGSSHGDDGKIGGAMKEVFDYLHTRYRNAGGQIGKVTNYFPQVSSKEAVRKASKTTWVDDIFIELDPKRMIDPETSLPFTEVKLREVLGQSYDRITTDGKVDLKKALAGGELPQGRAIDLDESRDVSRFFHFKDADAFFRYNNKYGVGDRGLPRLFLSHIDKMSRDIGALEFLGPRPNTTQRFLDMKMRAEGESAVKRAWTNGEYKVLRGFTTGDSSAMWWKVLTGSQNWMRSAMLGAASLSAISDTAFIAATARINGLSATGALSNYLRLVSGTSKELRGVADSAGFIADVLNGSAIADSRFAGEMMNEGFTGWLAGMTNQFSGLARMTEAAQDGIALEGLAGIARNLGKKFDDLDPDLSGQLKKFGLGADDWALMQKTGIMDNGGGGKFFNTDDLRVMEGLDPRLAADAANKVDDWVFHLRQMAANEGTLATKALTTGAAFGDGQTGSLSRALASSFFMFKTFPLTVIMSHTIPALKRLKGGRVDHAAWTFIGTTLIGAMAMQLKQVVKGKTPEDMNKPGFWIAANLQGGGAGLIGDFFLGDYSRFGRSPVTELMTGPFGGTVEDVFRATKGNFDRMVDEKDPNFGRDIFKVAKRNIPMGSLWYARLGMERVILDNLERMIDPNFDRRMRKYERKLKKKKGQEFWWKPGESPEPSKILE